MVGKSQLVAGKGRKFESWTFSRKVGKTNCTKLTLKEEDSSLNSSRTLRSYCVPEFITHLPSNTESLISLNVTQCKYSEVWCDCVSKVYGTASEFSLTQRLPWLLWQLWLWLFIFWNAHCVKSHFQHSMAGLSCFLKFVCLTLTSVTLYIDNFRHHHLWNSFNCFTSILLSFLKHRNQTAGQF